MPKLLINTLKYLEELLSVIALNKTSDNAGVNPTFDKKNKLVQKIGKSSLEYL